MIHSAQKKTFAVTQSNEFEISICDFYIFISSSVAHVKVDEKIVFILFVSCQTIVNRCSLLALLPHIAWEFRFTGNTSTRTTANATLRTHDKKTASNISKTVHCDLCHFSVVSSTCREVVIVVVGWATQKCENKQMLLITFSVAVENILPSMTNTTIWNATNKKKEEKNTWRLAESSDENILHVSPTTELRNQLLRVIFPSLSSSHSIRSTKNRVTLRRRAIQPQFPFSEKLFWCKMHFALVFFSVFARPFSVDSELF